MIKRCRHSQKHILFAADSSCDLQLQPLFKKKRRFCPFSFMVRLCKPHTHTCRYINNTKYAVLIHSVNTHSFQHSRVIILQRMCLNAPHALVYPDVRNTRQRHQNLLKTHVSALADYAVHYVHVKALNIHFCIEASVASVTDRSTCEPLCSVVLSYATCFSTSPQFFFHWRLQTHLVIHLVPRECSARRSGAGQSLSPTPAQVRWVQAIHEGASLVSHWLCAASLSTGSYVMHVTTHCWSFTVIWLFMDIFENLYITEQLTYYIIITHQILQPCMCLVKISVRRDIWYKDVKQLLVQKNLLEAFCNSLNYVLLLDQWVMLISCFKVLFLFI